MNRRIESDEAGTVSLLAACRTFGIGKSMGYQRARDGLDLTEGVRILRFGDSVRPVYRVSKAQIAAVLAPLYAISVPAGPVPAAGTVAGQEGGSCPAPLGRTKTGARSGDPAPVVHGTERAGRAPAQPSPEDATGPEVTSPGLVV